MKHILSFLLLLLPSIILAQQPDLNKPFGWACCTSLTSGDDYKVTGGSNLSNPRVITLTSNGQDMRQALLDAVKQNDIIILDGKMGDFIVGLTMRFEDLNDKTIVGINNARVCTSFYINKEIHELMNRERILESGTGKSESILTLSNGRRVGEEREYRTRQLLIDTMDDPKEEFRDAGLFYFSSCHNVIVRNLTLVGPGAIDVGGSDLMTASHGCQHLWIDHCDFIDGMDGNFDINSFSDFITISWCRFHYTERTFIHANTNLVGSSDRVESNGEDNLNITYAFCEWGPGCDQRMPMARFGTIHLLNNYYNCAESSAAVNPRFHSQFLIEGNYFEKGVKHIFTQRDATSYIFHGNHYTENFEQPSDLGTTIIPYTYQGIATKEVPVTIGRLAGATLIDPLKIDL